MYAKAGVPRNAVAMRETEGERERDHERASCGGLIFSFLAHSIETATSPVSSRKGLEALGGYFHWTKHLEEGREERERQATLENESNWKVGDCIC